MSQNDGGRPRDRSLVLRTGREPYRSRRGGHRPTRQPALCAEVRVAVFGNSHAIRAFVHPIAEDASRHIGRHRLDVKWVRPDGGTIGGLGGGSSEDWRRLDAATHALDGVWPSFAVICVGGPALVPRRGDRVQGAPVPLLEDAAGAAARVVSGMEHWLSTLELVIPGTRAVILSVLPERDLSAEALDMFRGLSLTLWQVARQRGAAFLDVEAVLRRDVAGMAPSSATATPDPAVLQGVTPGHASSRPATDDTAPGRGTSRAALQAAIGHLQLEAEEGLLPNRLLTASRAVASVATEVLEEAERAAREVAACRAALAEAQRAPVPDVAWATGWVPGRPPPPDANAAPPVSALYDDDGVHLTPSAYSAIRRELVRLCLTSE
ncbi:uncharacterized protein LOC122365592 isoform X4 [Amphibalanus amphitrite]|uniref:uncharacterized protein LOC122365032 n=1 Tax=Amphibalanus amphitrite TaxID=1232801 RepID=UPI001C90E4C4|nr:uncharacterized protein LOC122365032 [Amphibalanus amphitrite]XP_043192868.1 uncharacterized protein LOC122365592 isoform X4 [Amphibalanus amphitrite]